MENSARLLIRTPDELPDTFEIAKGLFVAKKISLMQLRPVRATFDKTFMVRAGQTFRVNESCGKQRTALKDLAMALHLSANEVMAVGMKEMTS